MENNLFCSFVHTGEVRQFNSNTEPCCKVQRSTDWKDKPISEYRDYLSQELNREVNTICSKSQYSDLTKLGIEMKTLIDQFREQVQNVE